MTRTEITKRALITLLEQNAQYHDFIVQHGLFKEWAEFAGYDERLMEVVG